MASVTLPHPRTGSDPNPDSETQSAGPLSWLRRLSTVNLVANILIVVTGGAVRLTDSGLGCPTWPRCTDDSYTNHPALGIHGYIEFGNRSLSMLLGLITFAAAIAAWRLRHQRPDLLILACVGFSGVAAQAVLGGITVLTGLNPWTVAAHFLVSMGLIYGAYALWLRSRESAAPPAMVTPSALRWLIRLTLAATFVTLTLGTIVTGSGPHAGDAKAGRTGLDAAAMSQLHADAVAFLVGLTIALLFAVYATDAPVALRNAAWTLLAVELSQGFIGIAQYFTGLPVLLVAAHLLGACLVWLAAIVVLFRTRTR